jgi:restriction system protein
MITRQPRNWKDLQDKVDFIFTCVGLASEKEKHVTTPRGTVELDVYAIDPLSLDKIKYIVECKNWNSKVPQTVIHGFTTVMNETGSNIGYIISKKGFQKGSIEYTKSTNIRLFTFEEFQSHYLESWYTKYFAAEIYKASLLLTEFTEPINTRRFRFEERLNAEKKLRFQELHQKYSSFSYLVLVLGAGASRHIKISSSKMSAIISLKDLESALHECFQIVYIFGNYLDALETIKNLIAKCVDEFIQVFGTNIFSNE